MNGNWKNKGSLVMALCFLLSLGSCGLKKKAEHSPTADVYTCPMHPQIIRDKPGLCPVCGMDLVKKTDTHSSADSTTTDLGDLLKPVNAVVISSIRTIQPEEGEKEITWELPGTVEYDTRQMHIISSRFSGRIEKLYVRYPYQPVRKGEKLLEIYSPQLVTAQQELLFLLTQDADNQPLIDAARRKLRLLGLSPAQITQIASSRQPQYRLAIYSPYDGYVVENQSAAPSVPGSTAIDNPATGGMNSGNGMSGGGGNAVETTVARAANDRLPITEGSYLSAGQPIFRVVNTKHMWALFQSYPGEVAGLQKGQSVQIMPLSHPDQTFTGKVDLIEPFYRDGRNTATLRVYLANPKGTLRQGDLLNGRIEAPNNQGLWIPREATLALGNRTVAFVKQGNTFHPVPIQTGWQSEEWVQIRSGISRQDEVAANAQYLVDSEGFVQTHSTSSQQKQPNE